eukprot:scaffold351_cov248-Pinguiococcus_pyrenoidosus.AAC.11
MAHGCTVAPRKGLASLSACNRRSFRSKTVSLWSAKASSLPCFCSESPAFHVENVVLTVILFRRFCRHCLIPAGVGAGDARPRAHARA